jgi:adenine deaminase
MTKPAFSQPKPWTECARDLVNVAMGRKAAEVVVRNGMWVNVHSGEVIPATDLAIVDGRFAYCGPDASHCIGDGTKVVDARGRYLVPGLCDAHMHVESGMLTVTEFVRAVAPHGTTSMFVDPHEIANVLGLDGVRMMHDEAEAMPTNVFVQMPSCVPSAPGLEHAGASLGPQEIGEAMAWPNIIGLGEVMNFPGVAANDQTMAGRDCQATQVAAGKTVGVATIASPDLGAAVPWLPVAGGPEDDHEGTRAEDAIARVSASGMKAMLRLGSAWYDVAEQIKAVTEQAASTRATSSCAPTTAIQRHAGQAKATWTAWCAMRSRRGWRRLPRSRWRPINTAQPFQAGARTRLDHAGPAGRFPDRFRTCPRLMEADDRLRAAAVLTGQGRQADDRNSRA